ALGCGDLRTAKLHGVVGVIRTGLLAKVDEAGLLVGGDRHAQEVRRRGRRVVRESLDGRLDGKIRVRGGWEGVLPGGPLRIRLKPESECSDRSRVVGLVTAVACAERLLLHSERVVAWIATRAVTSAVCGNRHGCLLLPRNFDGVAARLRPDRESTGTRRPPVVTGLGDVVVLIERARRCQPEMCGVDDQVVPERGAVQGVA